MNIPLHFQEIRSGFRSVKAHTRVMISLALLCSLVVSAAAPARLMDPVSAEGGEQAYVNEEITVCQYADFGIEVDTVWETGNTYILDQCAMVIASGITLTIQPGAAVNFLGNLSGMRVFGNLLVQGTAEAPVQLTGALWHGIVIDEGATANMDHAIISGAGYFLETSMFWGRVSRASIDVLPTGNLTLTNSQINSGNTHGIYLVGSGGTRVIHDTSITNNRVMDPDHNPPAFAIYQSTMNMQPDYANLSFSGNDIDKVYVNLNEGVSGDITFGGAPLQFYTSYSPCQVSIPDGRTLTIQPGADLTMANAPCSFSLQSGASLIAEGNESQRIAIHNSGFRFYPNSSGSLSYCDISGGGSLGNGLRIETSGVVVEHSTITENPQEGIFVAPPLNTSVSVTLNDVAITDNAYEGLRLQSTTGSDIFLNMVGGSLNNNGYNGLGAYTSSSEIFPTLIGVEIRGNGSSAGTNSALKNGVYAYNGVHPHLEGLVIEDNPGSAVQLYCDDSITAHGISAANNGSNAVDLLGCSITSGREWDFKNAGVPINVLGNVTIQASGLLTLTSGTHLNFGDSRSVSNMGKFYSLGTAEEPIVLTGMVSAPGSWGGIQNNNGKLILLHTEVAYGGRQNYQGIDLYGSASSALIQNSKVINGAGYGVFASYTINPAEQVITNSEIYGNAQAGVSAYYGGGAVTIDARNNWWGDASGPTNPANPSGLGEDVTNFVLFNPWLTEPPQEGGYTGQMIVNALIQDAINPGETVDIAVQYLNLMPDTVNDAVLLVQLPAAATYLESSPGGMYWPERHQVFWKFEHLDPGENDFLFIRMQFHWGLPVTYSDGISVLFAGTNYNSDLIDVGEYTAYVPLTISSITVYSQIDFDALRTAHPDLEMFYQDAIGEGFSYLEAYQGELGNGTTMVTALLAKPDRSLVRTLHTTDESVLAITTGQNVVRIEDSTGGMSLNLLTNERAIWGAWDLEQPASPGIQADNCTYGKCLSTCGLKLLSWELLKNLDYTDFLVSAVAMGLLGWNGLYVVGVWSAMGVASQAIACLVECKYSVYTHCCNPGETVWHQSVLQGNKACSAYVCSSSSDMPAVPTTTTNCGYGKRCVGGVGKSGGCKPCSGDLGDPNSSIVVGPLSFDSALILADAVRPGGYRSCSDFDTRVAKDPNELFGPEGDLLPEQQVDYRITYENEGEGKAYGVYILNYLPEEFDESTLVIHDASGRFVASKRQLLWYIGELAPKGEEGSSGEVTYSVSLRSGLPSGTTVVNQAVVFFPSVPEETPTNPWMNRVSPLVATPQTIETSYATPIAITLTGRNSEEITGFTVTTPPVNGTLTGDAPTLTYTPNENFVGADGFSFTVSGALMTSDPADVQITVLADGDLTRPHILNVEPGIDAQKVSFGMTPLFSVEDEDIFAPLILVRVSEVLDEATFSDENLKMVDSFGHAIPLKAIFDPMLGQLVIFILEPLEPLMIYEVTLKKEITDLAGNAMEEDYSWEFSTTGDRLYLPAIIQ